MTDRVSGEHGLTASDLVALSGASYRQIDHWTRRGYLVSHERNPGKGNRHSYSIPEMYVARVLVVIAGWCEPKTTKRVARRVRGFKWGRLEVVPGVILDLDVPCAAGNDKSGSTPL